MMNRIPLLLILLALLPFSAHAQMPDQTVAKQALVIDYDTGAVLLEKNADERMPTSSMSKVLTSYVVFQTLRDGNLRLEDKLHVSEKAWRMEGSKMFVEVDKQVKVEDLLRGVIIQSGNDATVVLAEGIAGNEDAFAGMLNATAEKLGMTDSHFANASGWPNPDHYSTARDLAKLAVATIRDFPEYYPYFGEIDFTYNGIKQGNRNPLLYRNIGADGIKTGHTEAGGFGLIASGKLDGRRVVEVLNGMKDEQERADEGARLLEWALKSFENRKLFTENEKVEDVKVAMSPLAAIPAVLHDPLLVTLPRGNEQALSVTATFTEPLVAPVQEGQEVGQLTVNVPGQAPIQKTLYAGAAAPPLGFFAAAVTKAKLLLSGSENKS